MLPRFFYASKNEAKALAVEIAPREAIPQRVVVTTLAPRALPSCAASATSPSPASALSLELGGPILPGERRVAMPDAAPTIALGAVLPDESRHVLSAAAPPLDFGCAILPDETAPLVVASRGESGTSAPAAPRPVASMPPCAPARVSPPNAPRTTTEPLTATQHRLHATVSKEFVRKLAAAKDALSHSLPGADEAAILEAGLDLILERAAKRKGLVKRPRKATSAAVGDREASQKLPMGDGALLGEEAGDDRAAEAPSAEAPESRHIPAAVQREVWTRDGGRCAWPTADGGVCGSTHRLQFDHIVPVAKGGRSTTSNVRVCCAHHNDLSARNVFGNDWMDRYTRGAGRRGDTPPPARPAAPG